MAEGSLARRYAQALVELGREAHMVDRLEADLSAFIDVLGQGDGLLSGAMNNPGLTADERRGILDRILALMSLHPYVQNFLRLLVDKNRFAVLDDIRRAYTELADDLAGRQRVRVTTATDLSGLMRLKVERALSESTGKKVLVTYNVDATLIGGVVAQVGDTVYDASVRARLREIQDALVRGPSLTQGEL